MAIASNVLHYRSIWIVSVQKPDTARGGDVYHHIPNNVKIHALLLHDVILLSCKMSYSSKVPSVYSPLLLPEDKMGFGEPRALWFLRIISSLSGLHGRISLCSELEELPAHGRGLDERLSRWVQRGVPLLWVSRDSPTGSWGGWKCHFETVSLASIGSALRGRKPMPVYILLCISRSGDCGTSLLVGYAIFFSRATSM